MSFVEFEQSIGKGRELEKVIFFRYLFVGLSGFRIDIAGLGVIDKRLADHGIKACVSALVDVAVLPARVEQRVYELGVVWRRGSLEPVYLDIELLPLSA